MVKMVEVLLTLQDVELHEVRGGKQNLLHVAQNLLITQQAQPSRGAAGLQAQIGSVAWALGPQVACLCATNLTYTFSIPGAHDVYYVVLLSTSTPSSEVQQLQRLLQEATTYSTTTDLQVGLQEAQLSGGVAATELAAVSAAPLPPHQRTTTDVLAAGMVSGGRLIGSGIVAMAHLASYGLNTAATVAVYTLPANKKPMNVSPLWQSRLENFQSLTGSAATTSANLAEKLVGTTSGVANAVIGGLGLRKVVAASGLTRLGLGAVDAAEAVFLGMEQATLIVLESASGAARTVVKHSYGEQAGLATGTSLSAAQCMLAAGMNVRRLRPTAIVKRVAKDVVRGGARPANYTPAPASAVPTSSRSAAAMPPALLAPGTNYGSSAAYTTNPAYAASPYAYQPPSVTAAGAGDVYANRLSSPGDYVNGGAGGRPMPQGLPVSAGVAQPATGVYYPSVPGYTM